MQCLNCVVSCFRFSKDQDLAENELVGNKKVPKNDAKRDDDFSEKARQKVKAFSKKIGSQSWEGTDVEAITKDYVKYFLENRNNIHEIDEEIRQVMNQSNKFQAEFFKTIQGVGKRDLSPESFTMLCRHVVVLV